MFFLYSIYLFFYFAGSLFPFPRRRGGYFSGFKQRFGFLPDFKHDARPVVWLHCFSNEEVEAARPFVEQLREKFPNYRLVISTMTECGHEIARRIFADQAALVFYFPFDWRFAARRALQKIKPNMVFMMENELWFNFMREAGKSGARVFILNGKISLKTYQRCRLFRETMRRVWHYVDEALVQSDEDAKRFSQLGLRSYKINVTGNIKFNRTSNQSDAVWTDYFQERFAVSKDAPLIVAANTCAPEEQLILDAFKEIWKKSNGDLPRLLIAPRDAERCDEVFELVEKTGFDWVRRTEPISARDKTAEIILLDSPPDIHNIYPLAQIIFVGDSLISGGKCDILEAAIAEKPIVTGFYTINCDAIAAELSGENAIVRLPELNGKNISPKLAEIFLELLQNSEKREILTANMRAVLRRNNGAIVKTIEHLKPYLFVQSRQLVNK